MVFAHGSGWFRGVPITLVGALLVLGSGRAPAQEGVGSLKERFLAEAPPAWEAYRAFAEGLSGTTTGQSRIIDLEGKPISLGGPSKFQIKQKEDHCLYGIEPAGNTADSRGDMVQAVNPRYAFRLARPRGKEDWILSQLDLKVLDGSTVDPDRTPLRERIHKDVARHFEVGWLPLSTRIKQPTFKVTRASAVHREARDLVRIEFDNAHPLPTKEFKGRYDMLQSGSLLFDPDHYWCVVDYDILVVNAAEDNSGLFQRHITATFEYRDGTKGFPILTRGRALMKPVPEKKSRGADYKFEYDLREAPMPEDEEFTLTAYGLPEPLGMTLPSRSRAWLWFALAGVAALAAGFLFRRFARPRAALQTAANQAAARL